MDDCIYLTRSQIEALYRLTFHAEPNSKFGPPRVGVQLRGNADATAGVVLDAVLDQADEVGSAFIDADGGVTGWSV